MAYDKNMATAFGIGEGTPEVKQGSPATHGQIEDSLDIRDILSGMVGKGYTDFSNPDAKNYFAYLTSKVGRKLAQDLFTHVFIFNQSDAAKQKSVPEKINTFYNSSSKDSSVDNIIKGVGHYRGTDPVAAANSTHDLGNIQATGREIKSTNTSDAGNQIKDIAGQTIKN